MKQMGPMFTRTFLKRELNRGIMQMEHHWRSKRFPPVTARPLRGARSLEGLSSRTAVATSKWSIQKAIPWRTRIKPMEIHEPNNLKDQKQLLFAFKNGKPDKRGFWSYFKRIERKKSHSFSLSQFKHILCQISDTA